MVQRRRMYELDSAVSSFLVKTGKSVTQYGKRKTIKRSSSRTSPLSAEAELFVPEDSSLSVEDVYRYFLNAYAETVQCEFSAFEKARLFDLKSGVGLVESRPYFRQAYCRPLRDAIAHAFGVSEAPHVLDVCCGTGFQMVLFALLGSPRVIGLDLDEGQLDIARRRIALYERVVGRDLGIETAINDVLGEDFASYEPFDLVYSHIGIGRLARAPEIFRKFASCLNPNGLLILKNGNPGSFWMRLGGRRIEGSTRSEYVDQAQKWGFRLVEADGATGLPRSLWKAPRAAASLDRLARRVSSLQVMVQYVFQKLD